MSVRGDSGPFGAPAVNFTVNGSINSQLILAVLCFRCSSTHVLGSPGSAPRDLGVSVSLGGSWPREAREGLGEGETPKGRVNKCVVVVMGLSPAGDLLRDDLKHPSELSHQRAGSWPTFPATTSLISRVTPVCLLQGYFSCGRRWPGQRYRRWPLGSGNAFSGRLRGREGCQGLSSTTLGLSLMSLTPGPLFTLLTTKAQTVLSSCFSPASAPSRTSLHL